MRRATVEVAVLVGANLVATIVRFLLFRAWVFHPRRQPTAAISAQMHAESHRDALVAPVLPASEEAV